MLASLIIRPATAVDRPELRKAVVELQDYEHRLHATRLPGEMIAGPSWANPNGGRKNFQIVLDIAAADCDNMAVFAVVLDRRQAAGLPREHGMSSASRAARRTKGLFERGWR